MDNMETERLRLRRFTEADLPALLELESDPEVVRFTPMAAPLPQERTKQRLLDTIAKQAERAPLGVWACETKAGEFVGWFMLLRTRPAEPDPELGFMILRRQWGKGYATEAARRLLHLGLYELGHSAVLATVQRENAASKRILEKLGFQLTGSHQEPRAAGAGELTLDDYLFWA